MKPAQIMLLLVAVIAGGLAFFLATRGGDPAAPQIVTETVQEQKAQILVAKTPIGVGQRLTAELVEWQDWPEGAVRPEYITIATSPNAPVDVTGAVARFEFFSGEPIREQKLVRADQGYLSAVLEQGQRGVSIPVTAESGAGGFIVPNDRVDVVLSKTGDLGETSETVLSNVKVLAIGKRLGEMGTTGGAEGADGNPQSQVFEGSTIATLELDPRQSEIVINSAAIGRLSLTLRSIADFAPNAITAERDLKSNQTIRIIRYGKEGTIAAGSSGPASSPAAAPIVVNPIAYTSPVSVAPIVVAPPTAPAPQVQIQ